MSRNQSWDESAATGITTAVVALAGLALLAAAALAAATLAEIGRIYTEHAGDEQTSRPLWYALVGLLGLWLVCGIVAATTPSVVAVCAYTAAWGFFAYVIAIEVADFWARRHDPTPEQLSNVDTYLTGLGGFGQSDRDGATASNGKVMAGIGR